MAESSLLTLSEWVWPQWRPCPLSPPPSLSQTLQLTPPSSLSEAGRGHWEGAEHVSGDLPIPKKAEQLHHHDITNDIIPLGYQWVFGYLRVVCQLDSLRAQTHSSVSHHVCPNSQTEVCKQFQCLSPALLTILRAVSFNWPRVLPARLPSVAGRSNLSSASSRFLFLHTIWGGERGRGEGEGVVWADTPA